MLALDPMAPKGSGKNGGDAAENMIFFPGHAGKHAHQPFSTSCHAASNPWAGTQCTCRLLRLPPFPRVFGETRRWAWSHWPWALVLLGATQGLLGAWATLAILGAFRRRARGRHARTTPFVAAYPWLPEVRHPFGHLGAELRVV